ncbi:MAG: capsule assembly Wzi family protein [Parashewanella sp.]
MKLIYSLLIASALPLTTLTTQAAPWVDNSDLYLRADIQQLADAGVITMPINTYPLMWSGIGNDLKQVNTENLSPELQDVFLRVNYRYKSAVSNRYNTKLKLAAANEAPRFQHFGSDVREKGQASVSYENSSSHFAFGLSATAALDPADDKTARFDNSYLAFKLGNWVFRADTLNKWWGPGFDSSLQRSNNARPMPSISISRDNASAFETPLLSWVGPWTLTAGFSLFEKDRFAPNALLWNFRGTIRPFTKLEVGLSWNMQFCGQGQECNSKTFLKALAGKKDCRNDTGGGCTNFGNQIAGYDIRYSDVWFSIPIGVYTQRTCEDSKGKLPWQIVDCANQFGLDTRFASDNFQYKLFTEFSDTGVACTKDDPTLNCFYEHSIYQSGFRYYKQSVGSTYDNDTRAYVLGLIGQQTAGWGFTTILRRLNINYDGNSAGNKWINARQKEDLTQLEFSIRHPLAKGLLTLGGAVAHSNFIDDDSKTEANIYGAYEYRF